MAGVLWRIFMKTMSAFVARGGWGAVMAAVLVMAGQPCRAGTIQDELKGDLVSWNGKKVAKADNASIANVKVFAFYFSAHWCPPCRAFTPELVKWYNENKAKHPEFELVFVSSDRSEEAMAEYMEWGQMKWPAIEFDSTKKAKKIQSLAARGIPYMVVTDADGKVLAGRPEGEDWVHPSEVLTKLGEILAAGGAKG